MNCPIMANGGRCGGPWPASSSGHMADVRLAAKSSVLKATCIKEFRLEMRCRNAFGVLSYSEP